MRKLLILILVLSLSACGNETTDVRDEYALTFRLAESHPTDHPTSMANVEFARLVEAKSQGRIRIIIYNNKQLGEEKDVIEQVQFGAIDFARVSTGPMSDFVPKLYVIQLPYLYRDGDHMWKVLNSDIGDDILKSVSEAGFIGFGWYDGGVRSFYNNKRPIKSIEDLKGLKFRVMRSAMMTDMVEALSASAVEMDYGDVYSAIQTGLIDGAENNWPSYDTSSHFEVAKYYSIDEHIRVPEILIGSQKALANLSEADLSIIREAAKETESYQRALWNEKEQSSELRLKEMGIIVNVIEDRTAFSDAMLPLYEAYAGDYLDLIEEIKLVE